MDIFCYWVSADTLLHSNLISLQFFKDKKHKQLDNMKAWVDWVDWKNSPYKHNSRPANLITESDYTVNESVSLKHLDQILQKCCDDIPRCIAETIHSFMGTIPLDKFYFEETIFILLKLIAPDKWRPLRMWHADVPYVVTEIMKFNVYWNHARKAILHYNDFLLYRQFVASDIYHYDQMIRDQAKIADMCLLRHPQINEIHITKVTIAWGVDDTIGILQWEWALDKSMIISDRFTPGTPMIQMIPSDDCCAICQYNDMS